MGAVLAALLLYEGETMAFSKATIIKIVVLLLSIYIGICIGVAVMQERFLYHPNPIKSDIVIAQQTIPTLREVHYPSETSPNYAFYAPAQKGNKIVVFLHGNSYHLNTFLGRVKPFVDKGYGVLMPEYTGFGGIEGDIRQSHLERDVLQAIDFLKTQGYSPKDIILYGYSLGTYLAVYTASETDVPFYAVVLEAPFTSLVDVAFVTVHYLLPVGLLMKDGYFSIDRIKNIRSPLFIAHGKKDTVVPYEFGYRLFLDAETSKTFFSVDKATHRNLPEYGLFNAVWDWLQSLS